MPRNPPDTPGGTRARLIATAEQLFLERGMDAVSLREIGAAAGARNASAVQYHLGDRAGLITAILDKHRPGVDAHRHDLLDVLEDDPDADLRGYAAAYVLPLATKLADDDGGPGYLQVLADVVNRPEAAADWIGDIEHDSTERWRKMLDPLMAPIGVELHRRFTAAQFTHTRLAQRARETRRTDQRLFTSHLVDLVTALLGAPVSPETAALHRTRRRPSPRARD